MTVFVAVILSQVSQQKTDRFNVDWVPTLNLRHSKGKKKDSSTADQDRVERAKARRKNKLNETKVEIEKKLRLNDEGT